MTLLRFRPTFAVAGFRNMQTMTGVLFFLLLYTHTLVNLVFGRHTKGELKLAAVQTKQTGDTALLPDSQGTTCLSRPAHIHPPLSSSRSLFSSQSLPYSFWLSFWMGILEHLCLPEALDCGRCGSEL